MSYDSNISTYEGSAYQGRPIECYRFTYDGLNYNYTSAVKDITLSIDGKDEVFYHDYIMRGNIKPSEDGVTTISTKKDNNIAMLYQGSPPEQGRVNLSIFRAHRQDLTKFDKVLEGTVSQVNFNGSQAEISVTQENYLNKEIPNGKLEYHCNNRLFDHNCRLDIEQYKVKCTIKNISGLSIQSDDFLQYPEGYFIGGMIWLGNNVRTVASHKGNMITIKYPLSESIRTGEFAIAPGCDALFKTCAIKFGNTDNFYGCPYTPPTDSEKNPVGKGSYWIDTLVVQRDTNGFVGTIDI